jgi:excisionase family DNA binding protein
MAATDQSRADLVADGMVTIAEAQEMTRLSRSELYVRMDRGELPFAKLGKRRMIPRKAIIALMAQSLVGA